MHRSILIGYFKPGDYPVSQLPDTSQSKKEYVIQAEDVLTVNIFSKNGYALIDVLGNEQSAFASLSYRVNPNGYARLPMLDSIKLEGMTVGDAEKMLEEKYGYYFVQPLVRIEVTNRRVYVYRGRAGATVVTLDKDNETVLDVIAKAGGIPPGGFADDIKIIRGDLQHPQVMRVDLSTIQGLTTSPMQIKANDIIYIESRFTATDVVAEFMPYLALVSTLLLLTTTILAINNL